MRFGEPEVGGAGPAGGLSKVIGMINPGHAGGIAVGTNILKLLCLQALQVRTLLCKYQYHLHCTGGKAGSLIKKQN